jgi:DME family drug/metabolite transporter
MAHPHALSVGRGLFFIAFAATAWGVGGFVAAILYRTSGLGPIAVSFWRFVGGVALLLAVRPLVTAGARRSGVCGGEAGQSGTTAWRVGPRRMILTGIGFAVYQTAYYAAIQLTGLAIGTVVTLGAGPVLIAVGARLFLGERLGVRGLITVAASLVGLVLLTGLRDAGAAPLGVAVALLSATGYAAVTLFSRASSARHTDDALDSALGGFAVGAVCLLPLAAVQGLLPSSSHVGGTLGLLAFLGAVPTALAYAMFFAGLSTVRATTASVVALVEPVAAAVLAVAVLGERLTPAAYAGGAVLLASVAILALRESRDLAAPS